MNSKPMECQLHHQKFAIFCPVCTQFLCCDCECPHFPDVKTIPVMYINKYLHAFNMKQQSPNQDQINAIKKELIDEFNKEEANLKSAFIKSVNFLDSYVPMNSELDKITNRLKELGVNDKGFALINSIAEKRKAEDIDSPTGPRSFLKYIEKGKQIIKEIESITAKFTDLLTFLNIPLIYNSTILHYWSINSMTIEDTLAGSKKVISLNSPINNFAESIACMGRIFIMGGGFSPVIADVYEFDLKSNTLLAKSPMLVKKYAHSLCTNSRLVYSVGGYNSSWLVACERYDVTSNAWLPLPNLFTERCYCASFTMNNSFLFALAGNNNIALNLIERLNLNELKQWSVIAVSNMFSARSYIHSIQISINEALVFGGNTNECFILKMNEGNVECIKHANLSESASFNASSAPIFDGKCVYGVSTNRRIHRYSMSMQTWS